MSLSMLMILSCLGILLLGLLIGGLMIKYSGEISISNIKSNVFFVLGVTVIVLSIFLAALFPEYKIKLKYLKNPEYEIMEVYEEYQPIKIQDDRNGDIKVITDVKSNNIKYQDCLLIYKNDQIEIIKKMECIIQNGNETNIKYASIKWGKITHKTWILTIPE